VTVHQVSDVEWGVVKWIERLLTPLLLLTIVGSFSAYLQMSEVQAQTAAQVKSLEQRDSESDQTVKQLQHRQHEILQSQHKIEVTVERVETNQRNFKEQLSDVKRQNAEILRILQNNGSVH
jgi:TolA-binding protein